MKINKQINKHIAINLLDEAEDSVLKGIRRITKFLDTEMKKPLKNQFENMKVKDYYFIQQKVDELNQISKTQSPTTVKQNIQDWSNLVIKLEFVLDKSRKQIETMNLNMKQLRHISFIIFAINNEFEKSVLTSQVENSSRKKSRNY